MACPPIVSAALAAVLAHWGLPQFSDPVWRGDPPKVERAVAKGSATGGGAVPPPTVITDATTGETYCASGCTFNSAHPLSLAITQGSSGNRPVRCGHTFLIPAGTYSEPFPAIQNSVRCMAGAPNPWLIKLQGVPGTGGNYARLINSGGGNGKAVLDAFHGPTWFDHLEILGGNGGDSAAARGIFQDAQNYEMIITNSWIHDNQTGFESAAQQAMPGIAILYNNRLDYNGDMGGEVGFIHNAYVGDLGAQVTHIFTGTLIFVNNLTSCVYLGHELKTRAEWNFIINNRFLDCDNTTANITSGRYDPATGNVTLTIDTPLHMYATDSITVNATGTGSIASINGGFQETSPTIPGLSTTVTYQATAAKCAAFWIHGTLLAVHACNGSPVQVGEVVTGPGVLAGTHIAALGTCNTAFGGPDGSCTVDTSQQVCYPSSCGGFATVGSGLKMTITGGTVSDHWGFSGHTLDFANDEQGVVENNVFRKSANSTTAVIIHDCCDVTPPAGQESENSKIIRNNIVISPYNGSQFIWTQGTTAAGRSVRSSLIGNTMYGSPVTVSGLYVATGVDISKYASPMNRFLPLSSAPAPDFSTPTACQ